ncbi:MAG TPA: AAA family ATPase [Candidatus Limnocylindrales bacterium]|nr:AAA family ATPase [Candidatus Limnocylindrales bacterium]
MLFGRDSERHLLESLLDDARGGHGRTLIVRGEAGMGKSALLEFAAAQASDFQVSATAGVESESELPFAGLLAVSRPLLRFLPALPEAQRTALEAALAITSAAVADRFTAYAGALTLVAAAAEERPLLVLVDDLQWLDAPSSEALLFVARRLGPDRVAIVMTLRAGIDDERDIRGLDVLEVRGLDLRAGVDLVRTMYGESTFPDSVVEELVRLTGGAPLALMEIPALLTEAQLAGLEPLPDPLPAGDSIKRAFHRLIEALPQPTREALLLLAAEDQGSLDLVARALANGDSDPDALEPAETARLIRVDHGRAIFRHPLLRSAVYHEAPPADRRRAHHALAAACDRSDAERRAWHLAAAAIEPDEAVASALEAAAHRAQARAAFASASRALERAADVTPDFEKRARRLLEAAENAWRAREISRTERLLTAASSWTSDKLVLADVLLLRGRFAYMHGSATEASDRLVGDALAVAEEAPETAVSLLMQASWAFSGAAALDLSLDAAERAFEIAKRVGDNLVLTTTVALSVALMLRGRSREARSLLGVWKTALQEAGATAPGWWENPNIGVVLTALGDYEFAEQLLRAFHVRARATPETLPTVLAGLSQFEYRTGDWAAALAHASTGAQLAIATGQTSGSGFVLANLAVVEAGLGRVEARSHARQVEDIANWSGFHSLRTYVRGALGLLDLGAGHVDSAIQELERVGRMVAEWGVGEPSVVQWMPDLVEAYARTGRRRDAATLLETLSIQADQTDGRWARAVAARCEGMLADSFDEPFSEALRIHATMPTPFDLARTQLCYGERLRRAGRRVDSREQLRPALETFERLGAVDWARRAAVELGGSAEHRAPRDRAIDHLSPQELQVALIVADGATNREVAAALFVTTKTVEFHLRNVYSKLGIRSRTELAAMVASRRGSTPEAAPAEALPTASPG